MQNCNWVLHICLGGSSKNLYFLNSPNPKPLASRVYLPRPLPLSSLNSPAPPHQGLTWTSPSVTPRWEPIWMTYIVTGASVYMAMWPLLCVELTLMSLLCWSFAYFGVGQSCRHCKMVLEFYTLLWQSQIKGLNQSVTNFFLWPHWKMWLTGWLRDVLVKICLVKWPHISQLTRVGCIYFSSIAQKIYF